MSGVGVKCEVMWGLQVVFQHRPILEGALRHRKVLRLWQFPNISWFLEEFKRKRHKTTAAASYLFFLLAMY